MGGKWIFSSRGCGKREDALEKIEALEPDLILTDIRMPYMDGLTLAERVRQKYPSMKIVFSLVTMTLSMRSRLLN